MSWFIRGAFLAALIITAAWGYMNLRALNKVRTERDTAIEVATTNAASVKTLKLLLSESEKQNRTIVVQHNQEIQALFAQSEATRKAAQSAAERLLGEAAIWRHNNAQRGEVVRADTCEARLSNIDKFLGDYIEEVRDVSGR